MNIRGRARRIISLNWRLYLLLLIIAALSAGVGIVIYTTASEFHTYYYGSANVEHDTNFGGMVEGDVSYGGYCGDIRELMDSKEGDVYITGRADSARNCRYVSTALLGIAVVGWGNGAEQVTEAPDNAIVITHGKAHGSAVDFYIDYPSLSEAMPNMANILMEINAARTEANLSVLNTMEMKHLLKESSDGKVIIHNQYYGLRVNRERAVDYAVNGIPPPPPPPPAEPCVGAECAFLVGAVDYLLLLTDDDDTPPPEEAPAMEPEAPTSTVLYKVERTIIKQ